ncbi:MAG: HAD-IB family hydrolase [Candidatus Taylorbacteria bacterium]|nr:HAD-IB family hydrolase [Candidatus Taylorbacteria bacterium]
MIKNSVHRKVAIFDIDGTIFRSSLLIELVEALIKEGIFPKNSKSLYERQYSNWVNRKGSYEDYIEAVIEAFMQNLKGVNYSDFEKIGLEVVIENKDKVYRYTRDLVKKLKKRGYYLLAISQSPKGLLDAFCKRLGFNKIYGRFYELGPSDEFTGEVVDLHLIANKANIVRRAVAKEKLTLKGSIGVGDTEGDIPMLELVDTAICFNPNQLLYRYAKMNKWKVVVERKDVIYEI